jgi:hypothetical protein
VIGSSATEQDDSGQQHRAKALHPEPLECFMYVGGMLCARHLDHLNGRQLRHP